MGKWSVFFKNGHELVVEKPMEKSKHLFRILFSNSHESTHRNINLRNFQEPLINIAGQTHKMNEEKHCRKI